MQPSNQLQLARTGIAALENIDYVISAQFLGSVVAPKSVLSDGFKIAPSNQIDSANDVPWVEPSELQHVLVPSAVASEAFTTATSVPEVNSTVVAGNERNAKLLQRARPVGQPLQIIASAPIGIWEGEVLEVDSKNRRFSAKLTPLRGSEQEMSGDLSFDQISFEDRSLVIPGSVFYIEQYIRNVKKQTSYDQRVRFRRLPVWTAGMSNRISIVAKELDGIDLVRVPTF